MPTHHYVGITAAVSAGALALAALVMLVTTPVAIGPIGVTGWFGLVLVGLSGLAGIVAWFGGRQLHSQRAKRHRLSDALRRGVWVGGYITTLLALSSLKQLNLRDALLMLLLIGLVEFYVVARS